ncbi:dynamin family protein [Streptomyces erythrochromogenes]|uniref:dynamin family protein n=1 Tax=Streptomyces erythrochromogenes TaxID=285574 RepID=UPI00367640A9
MSNANTVMSNEPDDRGGSTESARAADAVELVDQVVQLLVQARELDLSWSGHVEGESGSVAAMRQEWEAVRGGELRMSVVAPMKAGKSTLVNAIAGYELLPARAAAMTTLPTRIVLDRRVSEKELAEQGPDAFHPVLSLREEDVERFGATVKAIAGQLSASRVKGLEEGYPHLVPLIRSVQEDRLLPLRQQYQGRTEVQEALTLLNDLVRLAGRVLPESWSIGLSDVPVVRTPYWAPGSASDEGPGRLVVVDTPGPDEYELSEMLGNVVSKQLSESHLVLVVLDYTKMGGQSDARIRALMEPLLGVIGSERLFAVVNKIDQKRNDTDLGQEEIVRSVSANLGLSDATADARIFTTSAEWALASVRTLAAIKGAEEGFVPAQDEAAARLLKLSRPMDWEDELKEIDTRALLRVAQRGWNFSQIEGFLASAVAHLRRGALRLAVDSALAKATAELTDLEVATASRRDLIGRQSRDLAAAVEQITAELEEIAGFRGRVAAPAQVAARLSDELGKQLTKARAEGDRVVKKLRSGLRDDARDAARGGLLERTLAIKSIFRRGEPAFEFASADNAQAFVLYRTQEPKSRLDEILARTRAGIERSVGESAKRSVQEESERVRPVVERAAARVKDEFDLGFSIPDWELRGSDVAAAPTAPEVETRETPVDVEREVHGRSWRRLWIWKSTYTKTVTEVTEESTYTVGADSLADSLDQSFHACVDEIEGALRGHVREMVEEQVDRYYDNVEGFLQRYRAVLGQSAEDNQLEELKQTELRDTLTGFLHRIQALRAQVEDVRAV